MPRRREAARVSSFRTPTKAVTVARRRAPRVAATAAVLAAGPSRATRRSFASLRHRRVCARITGWARPQSVRRVSALAWRPQSAVGDHATPDGQRRGLERHHRRSGEKTRHIFARTDDENWRCSSIGAALHLASHRTTTLGQFQACGRPPLQVYPQARDERGLADRGAARASRTNAGLDADSPGNGH